MISCILYVLYLVAVHYGTSITELVITMVFFTKFSESMTYRFGMPMSCWRILYGKETMTYLALMNNSWVLSFAFFKTHVCFIRSVLWVCLMKFYLGFIVVSYVFLSKWYDVFMSAYHWECQQALCREKDFTVGLTFTTRPFLLWLVTTFFINDRNFILKIFEGFMEWMEFNNAYIIFYLSDSIDHSAKVLTSSDFQSIFPDTKPWLIQVHTV